MSEKPTTVADLILALATYPLESEVTISDPYIDLGVLVDGDYCTVYHEHDGVTPYERPDVIVHEVRRDHPGDEFEAAQSVLAWLRSRGVTLSWIGQGHNDSDIPLSREQRERLAEEYAARPTTEES